jgi:hypothetical protein
MPGQQASSDSFIPTRRKPPQPLRQPLRPQRLCGNPPSAPTPRSLKPKVAGSPKIQPQTSNLQFLIDTIPKLESRVTQTKQTTEPISNRYKIKKIDFQPAHKFPQKRSSKSPPRTTTPTLLSHQSPPTIQFRFMQKSPQNSNFSQPSPRRLGCGVYGRSGQEMMR